MQMDAGLDTGDMLLQKSIPIEPHDTAGTLEQRLADLGASLVVETLALLDNGDCPRAPQRPELATYAPSLPPDAGKIDWCARAAIIDCLIRGTTPRPGAFTTLAGKRLKIWEADLVPDATGGAKPGELLDKSQTGIMVATGDYSMCVRAVQPEGKARMSAADWARGARIAIGTRFEN
jgi:methionyl-tRNA formyltransferase